MCDSYSLILIVFCTPHVLTWTTRSSVGCGSFFGMNERLALLGPPQKMASNADSGIIRSVRMGCSNPLSASGIGRSWRRRLLGCPNTFDGLNGWPAAIRQRTVPGNADPRCSTLNPEVRIALWSAQMSLESSVSASVVAASDIPPKRSKRPAVTLEVVKSTLSDLGREGHSQTIENVIARVGGSKSTIVKHMEALRTERESLLQSEPSAVSAHVIRALALDIERVVRERTGILEGRLSEAQSAINVLRQECEELQTSMDESEEALDATRTALDRQVGATQAMQQELRGKSETVARAQADAESARQALALADARLEASEHRNESLMKKSDVLQQELSDERRAHEIARREADSARSTASILQTQLTSAQQLEESLRSSADAGERYRVELAEARLSLAKVEAENDSLVVRLQEVQQALSRSEGRTQHLLEKVLEGQDSPDRRGTKSKAGGS